MRTVVSEAHLDILSQTKLRVQVLRLHVHGVHKARLMLNVPLLLHLQY